MIDVRSLRPLDRPTLIESVKKTSRAVVVEEDWYSYGVGAELVATIQEGAFDYLDAPIKRVAQAEVPLPYAKGMEQAALPKAQNLVDAIKSTLDASGYRARVQPLMADVTMPRLSDTMEEGTIASWLKKPGEADQKGRRDRPDRNRQSHDGPDRVRSGHARRDPGARRHHRRHRPTRSPHRQRHKSASGSSTRESSASPKDESSAPPTEASEPPAAEATGAEKPRTAAAANATEAPSPPRHARSSRQRRGTFAGAESTANGEAPPRRASARRATSDGGNRAAASSADRQRVPAAKVSLGAAQTGASGEALRGDRQSTGNGERRPGAQRAPAVKVALDARAAPDDGDGANGKVRASPMARHMAAEHGLDLAELKGSGPQGRVIRADVEAALGAPCPADLLTAPLRRRDRCRRARRRRWQRAAQGGQPAGRAPPRSRRARPRARRMATSASPCRRCAAPSPAAWRKARRTVPHFFLTTTVDATDLVDAAQADPRPDRRRRASRSPSTTWSSKPPRWRCAKSQTSTCRSPKTA